MSIWNAGGGGVNEANLVRVGPYVDAVCSTDAGQTDINALIAAGKYRILLGPGAILTANLTIPSAAAGGFIWSPASPRALAISAATYKIDCQAGDFLLAGFKITGATGVGITVSGTGQSVHLERVYVTASSSHGLEFTTTGNDHCVLGCQFPTNGGSGIKIGASSLAVRIGSSMCWNNTLYGVDDQSDDSMIVGSRLDSNGSGAINGTPKGDAGNKKT